MAVSRRPPCPLRQEHRRALDDCRRGDGTPRRRRSAVRRRHRWPPGRPACKCRARGGPDGHVRAAGRLRSPNQENSGTNADDISDALGSLPVALHKETMSATWNREDQIIKQNPDLVVIHRSAFIHAMVLEFELGYSVPSGPSGAPTTSYWRAAVHGDSPRSPVTHRHG